METRRLDGKHPRLRAHRSDSSRTDSPQVPVIRSFALDTQRHLSLKGRYFKCMALPDRWSSWALSAAVTGAYLVRKHKVDAIVTTHPIASAVLAGYAIHKLTGKPWIADFRDSMTEDEYPADKQTREVYRWIERKAVKHGSQLIFTARSTIEMYRKRYPQLAADKCMLLSNGYDEEDFEWVGQAEPTHEAISGRATRLLHLGLIYPSERDPRPFFRAVAQLKKEQALTAADVVIDLRASGFEDYYSKIIAELGIGDMIRLLPAIPYPQAIRDAAGSDGLLIFQAANCDHQIPAKAYEYLRLRKPILALTSDTGDTTALFREAGGATIVDLSDEGAIFKALPVFLNALRNGGHPVSDLERVQKYARRNQAMALAQTLTTLTQKESKELTPGRECPRQGETY